MPVRAQLLIPVAGIGLHVDRAAGSPLSIVRTAGHSKTAKKKKRLSPMASARSTLNAPGEIQTATT